MHLALWWMLVSSDVTTGGTSTATPALKCHYFVKDHQAIAKNTTKTASHFYESLSNNLTSRLDNRSLVHVKGLALSNGWINYPTDLFLNGSNITSSFSWSTSWSKLLPELTSKMVLQVVEQVREETKYGSINSDAILSIDYEPKYRPSWNFTIGEGAAYETQPAWTALLHQVHNKQLDLTWIHLVGWLGWEGSDSSSSSSSGGGGGGGHEARRWDTLSKQQQRSLEEASWNYFVREYISTAISKMKSTVSSE